MADTTHPRLVIQHGLLFATLCLLPFAGILGSEILRGVIAVVCIALLVAQWLAYRKTINRAQFIFMSLVVAVLAVASLWFALNVARYYTYDGESGRSQAHFVIVRSQDALLWVVTALLAMISLCVIIQFVLWVSGKCRVASEPSKR